MENHSFTKVKVREHFLGAFVKRFIGVQAKYTKLIPVRKGIELIVVPRKRLRVEKTFLLMRLLFLLIKATKSRSWSVGCGCTYAIGSKLILNSLTNVVIEVSSLQSYRGHGLPWIWVPRRLACTESGTRIGQKPIPRLVQKFPFVVKWTSFLSSALKIRHERVSFILRLRNNRRLMN